jgi:hypothetical protein
MMATGVAVALSAGTGAARADVVASWNARVGIIAGPQIQRTWAMVHLAMFDAINAIEGGYTPYLSGLPAPPAGASAEAAGASAAHGVMLRLFPARAAELTAELNASLSGIPDGPAETDGVAYGDVVAAALYAARLNDNILAPGPLYASTNEPGDYRLTPGAPAQPVNTNAQAWLPFAMTSASQFRPGPPPNLRSAKYARDLDETRRYGALENSERTPEQDLIARWALEQAHLQLNRVARTESANDGRTLIEHARLFALLGLAHADAITAVFDAKYTYRFWRPLTAIQNADADSNPRTAGDPAWMPFLTTPPHPEFPAAHGTVAAAGTRVLTTYFGRHHAFTGTSVAVPGETRSFESFNAFAADAAIARIFGGMHYRNSIDTGLRQGHKVAEWILEHYLLPVHCQR